MSHGTPGREHGGPVLDADRFFYVVVHDVAPCFASQVERTVDSIGPLLNGRFSAGVVPDWHGTHREWESSGFASSVRAAFGELLLHGLTHRRATGSRLRARLCGNPDEFADLRSSAAAAERVSRAQSLFRDIVGCRARGFLPPAWRLTKTCWDDWRSTDVEFIVRYASIEFASGERWPIHTWSWDFGDAIGRGGFLGEWCANATRLFRRSAVPTVALHPADVDRALLRRGVDVVKRLLDEGRRPVLPSEFLPKAHNASAPLEPAREIPAARVAL